MEKCCIRAYHEMEERYARLVLEYQNLEQRKQICDALAETIGKLNVEPQTTITPKSGGKGEYNIEFHDDYDKQSGDFFEYLLGVINIKACE